MEGGKFSKQLYTEELRLQVCHRYLNCLLVFNRSIIFQIFYPIESSKYYAPYSECSDLHLVLGHLVGVFFVYSGTIPKMFERSLVMHDWPLLEVLLWITVMIIYGKWIVWRFYYQSWIWCLIWHMNMVTSFTSTTWKPDALAYPHFAQISQRSALSRWLLV